MDYEHRYPNGHEEEYENYSDRGRDENERDKFVNRVKKRAHYPSNTADSFIKNAITGTVYPWKVGSTDSKRLFKVVDTLGLHDSSGFKLPGRKRRSDVGQINPNPNHLYYDSPEEFMRHRNCTVSPALIESWLKTKNELFSLSTQ
jgi:hypothetical protein